MKLAMYSNVLFVFDNAVDFTSIKNYIPNVGHILITSIDRNWTIVDNRNSIDVFNRCESVDFILKYTNEENEKDAEELAVELEDYPLALEQAVAYIVSNPIMTIRTYLEKFHQYSIDEVKQKKYFFEDTDTPEFYNKKLGTTWIITLEKISEKCESAIDIINLCAFLSPEKVPLDLFRVNEKILLENYKKLERCKDNFYDEFQQKVVFGSLYRYSVINWDTNTFTFKVHRVIQFLIRAMLKKQECNSIYEDVMAKMLSNVFKFQKNNRVSWSECETYLPHVIFSLNNNEVVINNLLIDTNLNLCINMGKYYNNLRLINDADKYLKKSLEMLNRLTDKFDMYKYFLLDIFYELNQVYFYRSKYKAAEEYINNACTIADELYGNDDKSICKYLIAKGSTLKAVDKIEQANEIFKKVLDIDSNAFGSISEEISRDLIFLGGTLKDLGDLETAELYFKQALEIDTHLHGDVHQDVARDINNIANLLLEKEDYNNSLKYHKKSLNIMEKIYPSNHPKIAIALEGMGSALLMMQSYKKAKVFFEKALKLNKRMYGENNREYARVQTHLAFALVGLKAYDDAVDMYKKALKTFKIIYGDESLRYGQYCMGLIMLTNKIPQK